MNGPHATLDIRGEVCPYTFVKTRLALEEMQPGQVLRVMIDHEPATRSVPRSVAIYGDEVLSVTPTRPGEWEILVRKRVNESASQRINER